MNSEDFVVMDDNIILFKRLPTTLEFSELVRTMESYDNLKDVLIVSYNYIVDNIRKDSEYMNDQDRMLKSLLE